MEVNGKKVKLQIWDTAGQERFKNITASYYRGGNGVLVVYDITDRDSFENLNSWLIEIEKNANKNVYKLLIGNKCDLEDKRKVTYQEGKDFATSNGMQFIETSAKNIFHLKTFLKLQKYQFFLLDLLLSFYISMNEYYFEEFLIVSHQY
mgnify:CR=1 FL=1